MDHEKVASYRKVTQNVSTEDQWTRVKQRGFQKARDLVMLRRSEIEKLAHEIFAANGNLEGNPILLPARDTGTSNSLGGEEEPAT